MTTSQSTRRRASGFTLLELLVVVAIIGMIAAFSLAAVFGAQQAAREAHTKGLISKLHNQMALRLETYQTRRLPLVYDPAVEDLDGFALRQLVARRELMRMELPDQYIDLPLGATFSGFLTPLAYTQQIPALTLTYIQRIQAVGPPGMTLSQLEATLLEIRSENESAECLYMIMTTGMADENSGGEYFSERDIGDTDGDGMPEFIDAWGNPIEWIRWPAGFTSPLQPVVNEPLDLNNIVQATNIILGLSPDGILPDGRDNRTSDERHDPFDLWRLDHNTALNAAKTAYGIQNVDQKWFALFPLIMSPGRDEEYGIFFGRANLNVYTGDGHEYTDPYHTFTSTSGADIPRGMPQPGDFGQGHQDNIHNHSIGTN